MTPRYCASAERSFCLVVNLNLSEPSVDQQVWMADSLLALQSTESACVRSAGYSNVIYTLPPRGIEKSFLNNNIERGVGLGRGSNGLHRAMHNA